MDKKREIWKAAFIDCARMAINEGGDDFLNSLTEAVERLGGDYSCFSFDWNKAFGWDDCDLDEEEHEKYEQECAQMFQEIFGEPLY